MKLSKSIFKSDTAKYIYIGAGVILAIVIVVWIVKKIRKSDDEISLKKILKQIDGNNKSYSDAQYVTWADEMALYLGAKPTDETVAAFGGPVGFSLTSAGLYGVNQQGIYQIMDKMKTVDDVLALISAFGIRTIRKAWRWTSTTGNLNTFMSDFLTIAEKQEVNEILADNGVNYNF